MTALSPDILVVLTVAALLTSTLSGILGMGGGATLLGVMGLMLPPAAVVPLHAVVQLVSNLTRSLALLTKVQWRFALPFAVGLVPGMWLARTLWMALPSSGKNIWLRALLGAVLLLFLVLRRVGPKRIHLPRWGFLPLGVCAGFVALFVGAVGPFIAPFFLRDDLEPEEIVATKAGSVFVAHLTKIPVLWAMAFPFGDYAVPLGVLCTAVVVGTLIGRAVLARVARETFVRWFEGVLFVLGVSLVGQTLWLTMQPA